MKQKLKIHYNIRSTVKTPVTYWYPKLYRGTITPRASPSNSPQKLPRRLPPRASQSKPPEASQEYLPERFPKSAPGAYLQAPASSIH